MRFPKHSLFPLRLNILSNSSINLAFLSLAVSLSVSIEAWWTLWNLIFLGMPLISLVLGLDSPVRVLPLEAERWETEPFSNSLEDAVLNFLSKYGLEREIDSYLLTLRVAEWSFRQWEFAASVASSNTYWSRFFIKSEMSLEEMLPLFLSSMLTILKVNYWLCFQRVMNWLDNWRRMKIF